MTRWCSAILLLALLLPALTQAAPSATEKTAVVFIADYYPDGRFKGWGSGFFVDEGIVVTNRHVIEAGASYRVFATGDDDRVDLECSTRVTKSDVRLNLDDDVAYMRAFLPCDHGELRFADDPEDGAPVSVVGYPFRGSLEGSLGLSVTTGVVTGETVEAWLATDAFLDVGNSGGPVLGADGVVGVAVARINDADGNFEEGFFIPSTVIVKGLLYANNSDFGYEPQDDLPSSRSSASFSSASSSSSSSRSSSSSSRRSSSSSRSSSSLLPAMTPIQARVCARVAKRFGDSPSTVARLNLRLQKRFGFQCAA